MIDRKDAYTLEYENIGDVAIKDGKGIWKVGALKRNKQSADGDHSYTLYIDFTPNLERLPGANKGEIHGSIYIWHKDEAKSIKRRIKSEIGYTPEQHTLLDIWSHFLHYRDTFTEEDRFYTSQNKTEAQELLNALQEKVKVRFQAGEEIPDPRSRPSYNRLVIERYLNKEEINSAKEAQKYLNGHSYEEPMSIIARTGHLAVFNKELEEIIRHLTFQNERKENLKREVWYRELLEVDVIFRRMVALTLQVKREFRSSEVYLELAYQLFGYCESFEDYRVRVMPQLDTLLEGYGLRYFDTRTLISLGIKYLEEGGMLPIPTPVFTRSEDKIYYGDYIHNGTKAFKVNRSGLKYIYSEYERHLKREIKHFEWASNIEFPKSVDDYITNELARLNNYRSVPEAHIKPLEQVIKELASQKQWNKSMRAWYEERMQKEDQPLKKQALECFRDGLRCIELKDQIKTLASLSTVIYQTSYQKAVQELEKLQGNLRHAM